MNKKDSEIQADIDKAISFNREKEEIERKIDLLLAPIIANAIERDEKAHTMALLERLPRGFHRTKLRAWHIRRLTDYEYRRIEIE